MIEAHSNETSNNEELKIRGVLLTIWLSLLFCGGLPYTYILFSNREYIEYLLGLELYQWYPPALIILRVLEMILSVAIWNWRKWGIYGLIVFQFLGIVVGLVAGLSPIRIFLGTVIYAAIVYYIIKPKWHWFE